jgi:hypothetical protein
MFSKNSVPSMEPKPNDAASYLRVGESSTISYFSIIYYIESLQNPKLSAVNATSYILHFAIEGSSGSTMFKLSFLKIGDLMQRLKY